MYIIILPLLLIISLQLYGILIIIVYNILLICAWWGQKISSIELHILHILFYYYTNHYRLWNTIIHTIITYKLYNITILIINTITSIVSIMTV